MKTVLVYMPLASHGPVPVTALRQRGRKVTWDQPVKALPEADARDLLPGGAGCAGASIALRLEEAEKQLGIPGKKLQELAKAGDISTAEHDPRGVAQKPIPVVVLDGKTMAALKALAETSKKKEGAK